MGFENIKLKKDDPQHLYIQLYRILKEQIIMKKLKEEDRLPPVRKLAQMLGVNNVTVVSAYNILEQEGLIYKKIGSGTYVSPQLYKNRKDIQYDQENSDEDFQHTPYIEQGHIQIKEDMINFASATPSAELFPVDDFKRMLNRVLDRDRGNAFGYQESQGFYPLRRALQEYIRHYEIYADIDSIQIISGAQQGIDIISKGLLSYGDYVIMESPSYTGAMAAFRSRGAKIIDIPLEEDGLHLEILEKKIASYRPKLLYVMPNFQNPTGISYSKEKKQKIVEICHKHNVFIVEDDYLSDLNFYSEDHSTLKSMDDKDRVIYIKSFSKIFMPGLRLGFLIVPPQFHDNLLLAKHVSDISTSGLLQRAFELYLCEGIWQKHIQYMEGQYKERFEAMVEYIRKYMPKEVSYVLPQGGVNFWLALPDGLSSKELYEMAVKENVVFAPGSLFFLHNKESQHFRLSIASVNPHEIQMGIKILSKIIKEYIRQNRVVKSDSLLTPIL